MLERGKTQFLRLRKEKIIELMRKSSDIFVNSFVYLPLPTGKLTGGTRHGFYLFGRSYTSSDVEISMSDEQNFFLNRVRLLRKVFDNFFESIWAHFVRNSSDTALVFPLSVECLL